MAKILLIDDDPQMQLLITDYMGGHGHEVVVAPDGAMGLSTSVMEYPDIIILDMMMPVMDGPKALEFLKREPGLAGIPVVVVSANDDTELKQNMLDGGVVAYLGKPVNLPELLSCIEGTLRFRPKPS